MKKRSLLFKLIKAIVRFFYPRTEMLWTENIPDEPCVIVANHSQMNGPIVCALDLPGKNYIWCAAEMMSLKEVPAYAYRDFWSRKPKWIRWFYKILSYLIAPLSVSIFGNADTIPVYRDTRVITTYRESLRKLDEGANIVLFPEHDEPYNNILYDFQDRFVDLAGMYYRKTGKILKFVPMYLSPQRREAYFGCPVSFDPSAAKEEERVRVCVALKERITAIARALPKHRVVPYRNIGRRNYPSNLSSEPCGTLIKTPVVDYRQLRPKLLFTDKRFSHLKLLGGWLVYFVMYFLSEKLIPVESCHVIHCALDDLIPFNEFFLLFYCAWYVWIIWSLLYFLLYDINSFKKLQTYFIIVQAIAMVVYILYPSVQLMRPESFERSNILTWLMGFIYSFDTPTGVCPSLHVAYSIGICAVWLRRRDTANGWKLLQVFLCIMISISTAFVKQHSVVDIAAAIPLSAFALIQLYGSFRGHRPKLQEKLDSI